MRNQSVWEAVTFTISGSRFSIAATKAHWMRQRSDSFTCIPQRARRVEPPPFHKGYYRHPHHVENVCQRIKRLRRIATRHDNLAVMFLSFTGLDGFLA